MSFKKTLKKVIAWLGAKPAYAWMRYQCIYCGRIEGSRVVGNCPCSPSGKHAWTPIEQ